MSRKPERKEAPLRRPTIVRPLEGNLFLIVTEGSETEPAYLDALKRHLDLMPSRKVEVVHPGITHADGLVGDAIRRRDHRIAESRKSELTAPYDQVWVVLDTETRHSSRTAELRKAVELAREQGIELAISNPSFELWLLFHFVYTTQPFAQAGAVAEALKSHAQDWTKSSSCAEFMHLLPRAVHHVEKCRKHHGSEHHSMNPSTSVDRLVRKLNNESRTPMDFSKRA